jgi:hypothetical protein
VLATTINEEAANLPTLDPATAGPAIDVADEADHFGDLDLGDGMSVKLSGDDDEDTATNSDEKEVA